jgi:hypothetical protein
MAHLFCLYTWSLNLGQDTWDRAKVLLGTFQKPNENMMRTWKHIGNKKKNKKSRPPKRKFGFPWMHVWAFSLVTWNFYFQNCLSTFLTWPIDKGTNYGKELAWSVLISKDLVQFIYTKLSGQNKTKLSLNITRKSFTTLVWDYCFSYLSTWDFISPSFLATFSPFSLHLCLSCLSCAKANRPRIHEILKLPQLLSQGMLFPYIPYPRALPYT